MKVFRILLHTEFKFDSFKFTIRKQLSPNIKIRHEIISPGKQHFPKISRH